jgi:hypothetical protein
VANPAGAQLQVTVVIVLEGDRATVLVPAVGLDREPLVGPEEIDPVAGDAMVDERPWQTVAVAKE